jgi:hypothetical protein
MTDHRGEGAAFEHLSRKGAAHAPGLVHVSVPLSGRSVRCASTATRRNDIMASVNAGESRCPRKKPIAAPPTGTSRVDRGAARRSPRAAPMAPATAVRDPRAASTGMVLLRWLLRGGVQTSRCPARLLSPGVRGHGRVEGPIRSRRGGDHTFEGRSPRDLSLGWFLQLEEVNAPCRGKTGVNVSKREVDVRIITGVVEGLTQAKTAELAGISERTLRRRLREPSVVVAIAGARVQLHEQVLGRLHQLASTALTEIEEVMTTSDPATRLRAARLVLEQCSAYRGAADDARLSAMEADQAHTRAELKGRTWEA